MALADDDVRATLDHTLSFRPLEGAPVDLRVLQIDAAATVELRAEIDTLTWARILAAGMFHTDTLQRPAGWEVERPVSLLLRLRDAVARVHDVADTLIEALAGSEDAASRQTEAWFLLEAYQTLPVPGEEDLTTSIGVRSRWALEEAPVPER